MSNLVVLSFLGRSSSRRSLGGRCIARSSCAPAQPQGNPLPGTGSRAATGAPSPLTGKSHSSNGHPCPRPVPAGGCGRRAPREHPPGPAGCQQRVLHPRAGAAAACQPRDPAAPSCHRRGRSDRSLAPWANYCRTLCFTPRIRLIDAMPVTEEK